jgi:hypothetical protein
MQQQKVPSNRRFWPKPNLVGQIPCLGAANEVFVHTPWNERNSQKESRQTTVQKGVPRFQCASRRCRIVKFQETGDGQVVERRIGSGIEWMLRRSGSIHRLPATGQVQATLKVWREPRWKCRSRDFLPMVRRKPLRIPAPSGGSLP